MSGSSTASGGADWAGLMAATLILFLFAGLRHLRYLAFIAVSAMAIWGTLQFETHWSTYLHPATDTKLAWYEKTWGPLWHLLPSAPGFTVPDGYQTILFGLIMLVGLSSFLDMFRRP